MSQLAKLLGAYGPGHTLSHQGKDYVFRLVDLAAEARLEAALFKRQREAVYALRDEVPADEYDRALQRCSDAYARGEYGLRSDAARAWLFGEGFGVLVSEMTGCALEEARTLARERDADVAHAALCVWFASLPEQKKKLLEAERRGLLPRRQLEQLLSILTPPNGSTPHSSPAPASAPTCSPGSPGDSSPRSTPTPPTTGGS